MEGSEVIQLGLTVTPVIHFLENFDKVVSMETRQNIYC